MAEYKKWTEEETNELLYLYDEKGLSFAKIGEKLGRTKGSCNTRYKRYKEDNHALIETSNRKPWTQEEDELLRQNKNKTKEELRKLFPTRTPVAILNRITKLGLNRHTNQKLALEQEEFIRNNYMEMNNNQMARHLNVDRGVIKRFRKRENIQTEKVWDMESIEACEDNFMSIKVKFKLKKLLKESESNE
ncbi:SANT/Myb-like DNA-binding domain-containing protein [Staphylococcus chromogenes]|uniref:SANT/Myb-like DNA-binding domain-containing protein n=1 Tax=Staphylococcus chromogenes TaxID=46126 RepID=UPI002888EA77|nr:SANT/Myb-like DNA-binding domain-containing protein [Staphylococcus chromogenes]MDT0700317.1 SANT/Myb-like DNA-binding domain-containing protein [Staphylococcus chromogenes]